MSEPKKFVVLGHSGFLGKAVTEYLSHLDPASVVGLSSAELDLTAKRDLSHLQRYCSKSTTIVVCAAIKSDHGNSIETFSRNIQISENLASFFSSQKEIGKVILISSTAVYGVHQDHKMARESDSLLPDTYYGLAKYASEKLFQFCFAGREDQLIILRPTIIYGPGEGITPYTPSGFLNIALSNQKITLWGDGSEKREFVFIDDVAQIIFRLVANGFSGVLNIGNGEPRTYNDALQVIARLKGSAPEIEVRQRTTKKVDKTYDPSLLRQNLPDFGFTTLEQGVQKTFDQISAA